jgi:hypothetical protein
MIRQIRNSLCRDVEVSPKALAYLRRRSGTVIRFSAVISLPTFSAMLLLLSWSPVR